MKKNDIYEMTIEDFGTDGEGIGHVADPKEEGRRCAVFVKDTVVGDVIEVRILKVKKNYAYGRLEKLLQPSPYRVAPMCSNARRCGGCTLMHISYGKQLDYKWNKVRSCLERIGGFAHVEERMEPICGMEEPYFFRNKMQFPVGLDKEGKVQIGFYAGHTHRIIDMQRCEIGHPVNNFILTELRPWLQKWQNRTGTFIYDEERHEGLIRHILTRVGFATGEVMVCLVINGIELPVSKMVYDDSLRNPEQSESCRAELVELLGHAIDRYNQEQEESSDIRYTLSTLVLNINREKTNRILGDRCKVLWGSGYITDYIGDVGFQISPMSFYQVNPIQTKKLYDKAVEYAGLTGNEIVWDMYCGIGTISLCLAKMAKKVYGVEIVPQAVQDAQRNARLNGLTNTEFFCGKAEEVVPEFYQNETGMGCHPDVVVVDPPRKGCEEVLLKTIVEMAPKRLVYVSCDPATLARDMKILGEQGFRLERVGVIDQFGHSIHVETVCLLSKLHSKHHIEVELHMDEMDLTAAESKATYEEIKAYVLEHSGFKVSNLYIAQVKQKYGIIERECYNKPKSEDSRQPKCPPEKEAAITKALKYFKMI